MQNHKRNGHDDYIMRREELCLIEKKMLCKIYNKVSTIDGLDNLPIQKEQNGGPCAIITFLLTHF